MNWERLHFVPVAVALLGLLAAVGIGWHRFQVERQYRAVELVLDFAELRPLATATGQPLAELLERFKNAGMTGVAVAEETLEELQQAGALRVEVTPVGREWGGRDTLVSFQDEAVAARVLEHVQRKVLGAGASQPPGDVVRFMYPGRPMLYVPGDWETIRELPAGLNPGAVRAVAEAGLELVARPGNFLGATPESILWSLRELRAAGAETVVFAGEEVLGFRGQLAATAEALERLDFRWASVEFGRQRGDAALQRLAPERLVRLHSISPPEMARTGLPEAVERYVRAAAERNIRICYVRLPNAPLEETYGDNTRYVNAIAGGLQRAGLGLASARQLPRLFPEGPAGRLPALPVAAGLAALAVLLLALALPLSARAQVLLTAAFAAFAAALALLPGGLGLKLLALGGAVVGPVVALLLVAPEAVGRRSAVGGPLGLAAGKFALMCAVSAATGLMVAALLTEREFLLKIDGFAGVKLAHVLPLLGAALILAAGTAGSGSWPEARERAAERLRGLFAEPLRVWQALALALGGVALLLLVLRTGNEPGFGVSGLELRLRSLLDGLMVRPRTKEFLFSHPLLVLGLVGTALGGGWRKWSLPLLLIGVIGQASIVNTFCHLHTPLHVSVLRVFNGVWLGGLLGLLLAGAFLALGARAGLWNARRSVSAKPPGDARGR